MVIKSGWLVGGFDFRFGCNVGERCEKLAQNPVLREYELNLVDAPIKGCQKSISDSTTDLQLNPLCTLELRTSSSNGRMTNEPPRLHYTKKVDVGS